MQKYFKNSFALILFFTGCCMLAQGSYIHAKAWLAQHLLEKTWAEIQQGDSRSKPWPWADTWPVARLVVPRLDINLLVLAGDSGRTLAFGPGFSFASVLPGTIGNSIISAHRDTHFSFLKDLQNNDEITIETINNKKTFKVRNTRIAHRDRASFTEQETTAAIHLVTCYPFDSIITGGTDRYIVSAIAE